MLNELEEYNVIKIFGYSCLIAMVVLTCVFIVYESIGKDGLWLAYRALEFAVYGIFALGLNRIVELLNQLIGEMKFFRHHYILKDKEEKQQNE